MIFDPGWPTCAVCNKPVERCTRTEDHVRAKLTIVVECHGDLESVDILERELVDHADRIKFGRAFERDARALPPATPLLSSPTVAGCT
jgi:hypothetical protein